LLIDPWFVAIAVLAVLIVGIAKSGFLGGLGVLGVPLLTLVMPPVKAAAVMLPILIVMDLVGIWAYRRTWDRRNLELLLPAAILGVGVGWLTAAYVTDAAVRLIVGTIGVAFTLDHWLKLRPQREAVAGPLAGVFWGALTGFTSFVSHAGAPPFQIYVMPQRLSPQMFAGTAVMLFAALNAVKVVPYLALGQFNADNLAVSLALMPLAPLGVYAGLALVRRVPAEPFYGIAYGLLFLVSLKLVWDGLAVLV
jgi:hypothetical protein